MEALCKQVLEAGNEVLLIDELVEYCEVHLDEARNFKSLLYAVHLIRWEEYLSNIHDLDEVFSYSMYTFYCVLLSFPKQIDSPIKLSDFPLLIIPVRWQHETVRVPICNMSQQVVTDTIFGLEWHMLNDLMFTHRTDEWFRQARHLFDLLKRRISILVTMEHDTDVLDMKEYRVIVEVLSANQEDVGYDSDDQVYREKQAAKKDEVDLTLFENKLARASPSYLFICDAYVTSLDLYLFAYFKGSPLKPATSISVDRFRGWLYREMKSVNEAKICAYQSTWYESLVVTNSYIRVFQFTHGNNVLINKRNILLVHNEDLLPVPISTFREIEERPVTQSEKKIQLMSDGVFACYSLQFDALVKVLMWTGSGIPDDIYIYRDRIRNVWIFQITSKVRWKCASLIHAFIGLRLEMKRSELTPLCRGVNISAFDKQIEEFIM